MKKKINKKKAPAYAFGMDQLNNYLGGASVIGSTMAGMSDDDSVLNGIGTTLNSTGALGSAGLAVGGPIGAGIGAAAGAGLGIIGSIRKHKQLQELKRKRRTLAGTQMGLKNAAINSADYYDNNDSVYTFENGGVLPNLAYVDNNEVVRKNNGSIVKVPNNKPGTDNHLIDATDLESVLSDKLKNPDTKNTFAKDGKKLAKMTRPSKGKDTFAENTNRLNKLNANLAYEKLLNKQEQVKAKKGIKSKVKGIPAYADGTRRPLFYRYNKPINANNALTNPFNENGAVRNKNVNFNTAVNLGSPTTGTWFTGDVSNFDFVKPEEIRLEDFNPTLSDFNINPVEIVENNEKAKEIVPQYIGKKLPNIEVKPNYSRQSLQNYTQNLVNSAEPYYQTYEDPAYELIKGTPVKQWNSDWNKTLDEAAIKSKRETIFGNILDSVGHRDYIPSRADAVAQVNKTIEDRRNKTGLYAPTKPKSDNRPGLSSPGTNKTIWNTIYDKGFGRTSTVPEMNYGNGQTPAGRLNWIGVNEDESKINYGVPYLPAKTNNSSNGKAVTPKVTGNAKTNGKSNKLLTNIPEIEAEDFNPTLNPMPMFVDTPEVNVDEEYNFNPEITPVTDTGKIKGVNKGNGVDWLSLAPTMYNLMQAFRKPEEEPLTLNPYRDAVVDTMARRRMNIDPIRNANARTRAISNYNLANINANTGANLAARTQSAIDEYVNNAKLYGDKQNADNDYLGQYAGSLNDLGKQYETSVSRYNDLNARNRAAGRNFGANAASQLGKWSQVNRLMNNQQNRDLMVMPFLANFLEQGYTKDQVKNMYNGYFS